MTIPCRGEESVCAGCKYGIVIRRVTSMAAVDAAMWTHENPGQEDPRPQKAHEVDSYCTHPRLVGPRGGAREPGVVLSCELFEARKL